ncbi:MAG: bifunctional 4-hydroxy-2-oxoglutarate aldolase/2-dehydro-3-deoxy-phosphogluconate aldolase [Candidatus Margulisiibacteriota bacterium]
MILGIIRGATIENILPVIEAAVSGGIKHIEITLNSPDALEQIKIASRKYEVGAGTVLSAKDAKSAVKAGAKFIVSPIADPETINFCLKNKIPIYPGALTPSEVYRAWELGATMVKVFPVKLVGGPDYIKEIKGPFNAIKLLACSGVNAQNIKEYFAAGANAVAVGGSIFNKKLMDEGCYSEIEKKVISLVAYSRS